MDVSFLYVKVGVR